MAFNAGDVEAKLTLDRTPFTTGLVQARKQAEAFEKKPIKLKVTVDDQTKVPVTAMQKRLTAMTAKPYKVTIGANFGKTNGELTAFTKKLTALGQRKIRPEISVKTGKSVEEIEKVKAAFVGLTNKTFSIKADTSQAYKALFRLDASLTRLTRDRDIKVRITTADISKAVNTTLKDLKNTTIMIKADTTQFFKKIAEVAKTLNFINNAKVVATIRADSDVAGARTDLLSLELMAQRLSRERINIKVDVDRGMLDRLFGSLTKVGTAQNFASSGASRHTTRLVLLAGVISGLLGPALGSLAALLLTVPAAMVVFGQGFAAIKLGMDGIKKAAEQLSPQVEMLKSALTQRWEDKLTPIFAKWQGIFPILKTELLGQVDALSGWASAFTRVVTSSQGLNDVQQIMSNVNSLIVLLTPSVIQMTNAFMTLALVAAENFYSLSEALNGFTTGFNKFVQDAAATGELAEMFRQLGNVVGALLETLNTLFFIGMKLMVALGPDLTAAIKQLNQTFVDITPALVQLGKGFLEVVTYVAQFISWMAQIGALGPAIGIIVGFTVATKAFAMAMKVIQGAIMLYRGAMLLYTFVTGGAAAAQALLNAAMWANPVGVVVAAILIAIGVIAALAYGIYKLIENWDSVMAALKSGWEWLVGLFRSLWDPLVNWFSGLWGRITGAVGDAVSAVGRFFSDLGTRISTGFDNAMKSLAVFFENLPTKIAQGLGQAVGAFVRWIMDVEAYLDVAIPKLIDNILTWFQELPGNLLRIGNQAGDWLRQTGIDVVTGLYNGIVQGAVDIYNWAVNLPTQIGNAFVDAENWLDTTGWDILRGLGNGIARGAEAVFTFLFATLPQGIQNAVNGAGTWLWNTGGDILDGLIQGLTNGVNAVRAWFGRMADSFVLGFKQAMGIASPSTVFAEIGGFILEGLLNGVKAAGQAVIDFFVFLGTSLTNAFRVAFETIQNVAVTIWNAVSGFLTGGINGFVSFWSGVWNSVATFFSSVWNGIKGQAEQLWGAISSFLTTGVNAYKAFWEGVWNAIKAFFGAVWQGIQGQATQLWTAIRTFLENGINAFKTLWESIWNGIKTFFSTIWEGIKSIATTLWNAIKAYFDTSLEAYRRFWETIWNGIKTFFNTIWEGIKTVATTIWNAIKSFFDTSLEAYRRMWEMIWNGIKTAFTTIWEGIRDTGIRLWNALKGFFETSLDAFTRFWSGLWNGIRDNFGRIFEGIVEIAKRVWQTVKDVFRGGINAIVRGINWPIDKINGLFGISIGLVPEVGPFKEGGTPADTHRGGGPVTGRGGPRDDRVPAMLSPREHVLNAQEVIGLGGHAGVKKLRHAAMMKARGLQDGGFIDVNRNKMPNIANGSFVVDPKYADYAKNFLTAVNAGQAEALQAMGGRHRSYPGNRSSKPNRVLKNGGTVPKLAAGGAIQNAVNFARSQTGKPYQWGGAGNPSWDCSGFVGAITRVLRNQAPGRIGATGNFPWGGFQPGLNGSWAVGSTRDAGNGIGHMAGTLAGTNAESGGSKGVNFGGPAIGADNGLFNMRYFLPEIGGAFVSGGAGGGGFFDPAAFFDQLAKTIGLPDSGRNFVRTVIPNPPLPNWVEDAGVSMFDKGWAGLRDKAISLISMVSGALGGGTPGDPNVKNAVRQVAVGFGWGGGGQWDAIDKLVQKESSWNPAAASPISSARGLFQKMTSIHGPVEPTPAGQAQWGLNYIKGKYGDPMKAWAFHTKNNYYDEGGVIPPGWSSVVNHTGRNEHAAVFTTDQWKTLTTLSREEYATAAKNVSGISGDDLRNIVESLKASAGSGVPTSVTIAPQLPAGANVHDVIREITFYLRHYKYQRRLKA